MFCTVLGGVSGGHWPFQFNSLASSIIIIAQYDRNVNLIISIVLNLYTSLTCRFARRGRIEERIQRKKNLQTEYE